MGEPLSDELSSLLLLESIAAPRLYGLANSVWIIEGLLIMSVRARFLLLLMLEDCISTAYSSSIFDDDGSSLVSSDLSM